MEDIIEYCDEISVLSAFLRDTDKNNELVSPVKEIIYDPIVNRIAFLVKELGGKVEIPFDPDNESIENGGNR